MTVFDLLLSLFLHCLWMRLPIQRFHRCWWGSWLDDGACSFLLHSVRGMHFFFLLFGRQRTLPRGCTWHITIPLSLLWLLFPSSRAKEPTGRWVILTAISHHFLSPLPSFLPLFKWWGLMAVVCVCVGGRAVSLRLWLFLRGNCFILISNTSLHYERLLTTLSPDQPHFLTLCPSPCNSVFRLSSWGFLFECHLHIS